ncbi:hypothetical protein [Streptomyces pseudovenezuelae]|uniref:hypothetical protein n=1 Tax=Streptomyces pseudovenezuelae TaxID=67350 RepID=UPI002E80BF02|nr:hypothetical protein [Streptomyces pseudovenezuelae]WUA94480.1 hypothetical protein OHO81_44710 [Streptomyces pseudovenezuelae]
MGQQIIQQPDGRLAVFSTITDTFILMDATPEEILNWRAEKAAEAERERTAQELTDVLAGQPEAVYYRLAHTWEEACVLNEEHGGDLHPQERTNQ